uniref:Uncharacterized protein n=1 Tax=Brassica campestris TaxID=3711 RepID=M4FIR1_BRACM
MALRRSNLRDSDKAQTRTGNVNAEHIRSGDVSEALTEVFREETQLPRALTQEAMEANNEFAATLEMLQQDVPHSDELYKIKKIVRESEALFEDGSGSGASKCCSTGRCQEIGNSAFFARSSSAGCDYFDVLVSLKEKWEKKKAATDCEARLSEVMVNIDLLKEIMNNNLLASDELLRLRTKEIELGSELDVMAVLDFSVGKLDLPQISEDLPEDFFAKVPSAVDDVMKCSGSQFEDGEFGIEE